MSDTIRITTDAGWCAQRFQRYLARSIQVTTRSVEEVVKEQARGLVREAFLQTPPMNGRSFFQGKKASQSAIGVTLARATLIKNEARIVRALNARTSSTPREELERMLEQVRLGPNALAARIRANQRRNKTYPESSPKFYTTKGTRKSVRQIFEATMGITAAGWCHAARSLGVIFPEWIGRHSGKNSGSMTFTTQGSVITFKAVNPNRHHDSATIQRAINAAYDAQAGRMRNSLIRAIERGILTRQDVFGR